MPFPPHNNKYEIQAHVHQQEQVSIKMSHCVKFWLFPYFTLSINLEQAHVLNKEYFIFYSDFFTLRKTATAARWQSD